MDQGSLTQRLDGALRRIAALERRVDGMGHSKTINDPDAGFGWSEGPMKTNAHRAGVTPVTGIVGSDGSSEDQSEFRPVVRMRKEHAIGGWLFVEVSKEAAQSLRLDGWRDYP